MEKTKNGWLRPATANVPENYGFNAIRLDVPEQGKTASVNFRSLSKQPTIGHRYGLVAVTASDECIYAPMQSAAKGKTSLKMPTDQPIKALYLLVMGAPTSHDQDPSSRLFPYEVRMK